MATRNVVLTESQSALVDRLVASGRYQNASEALRAGRGAMADLPQGHRPAPARRSALHPLRGASDRVRG